MTDTDRAAWIEQLLGDHYTAAELAAGDTAEQLDWIVRAHVLMLDDPPAGAVELIRDYPVPARLPAGRLVDLLDWLREAHD